MQSSAVFVAMLAAGCASVPSQKSTDAPAGFQAVRDQPHYQVSVRPGEGVWPADTLFRLPNPSVADGAPDAGITTSQADLVANHAARSVCQSLAPWLRWTSGDEGGLMTLQLVRIMANNRGVTATSAVIDAAVPGPFRLPAGLGALQVASQMQDASGAPLLEMRWARGANPLLHRARISTIGDAWELAPSHGRDLRDALKTYLKTTQPADVQKANLALCEQRFGHVSAAGRAASLIVPLSPEAIDPARPPADPKPSETP